ncbi:uncharacterized protein F4822DRAFT_97733 [Hypoxylon trugodes]|uniref:uncharacterized protein n=1 Tax=Hypoxylon trugodes TaxID=326681 RepID=UPI0021A0AB74|nr:uncharacterized protein F4822DRAFT_97733 [Hypoxylon trugodes]KAI1382817.1 hypothetical protein F4822DRAFT_97733 [Hypoxylon trugodes]
MFTRSAFVAAVLAIQHVNAWVDESIQGHDFDFTATYASGLKLSTSEPPKDILKPDEIALKIPEVALSEQGNTDDRYISFLEISRIPEYDSINDVIYAFPWIKTNLIAKENGTLSGELYESHTIDHLYAIEGGEVRNATMHVWRQTPALMDFLDDKDWPILWQLARVWSNATSKVDYNFERANVNFKIQNATGDYRGDIDGNGASISGYTETATRTASATGTPTNVPSTTTGAGSAPASTTGNAGPTEIPSAASTRVPISWLTAVSGVLLLAPVVWLI